MSGNKRANGFLKECMADALFALMKEKEFSKITVNEIAETAGVNRSTWFRNFDTKLEALTYKIVQLWCRWADEHGLAEKNRYTTENAYDFFHFCHANRELLELMLNAGLQSAIYEAFYEIMKPHFEAGATERYQSRYLSYGLFGMLGEWIKGQYRESPDEMVAIYYRIINRNGITDSEGIL